MIERLGSFHKFLFDMRLEDYHNYIDLMEDNIDAQKSLLHERFDEQSEGMDEETKQEFYEHMFLDEYYDLEKTHSYILRKSLFISLYSFMESQLMNISNKLEEKELSKIKLSDISHSGTHKYFFYINTVLDINVNISKNTMKKFITYNNLRNYFVHDDSSSIRSDKYNLFNTLEGITFTEYPFKDYTFYQVQKLDITFNRKYLDLIAHFFDALFNSLDQKEIPL